MTAVRLLVLSALRQRGRAHGYQVRSDLESWGAHEWSTTRPGSIHHALRQMAKQGLLVEHEVVASTAGGPPRTEYEITTRGNDEFLVLLREALVSHDQRMDSLSAGIGFIVHLPRAEAVALLRERVGRLEQWRRSVADHGVLEGGPGPHGHIGEIMHLWVHTAEAGAEWTRGLIGRIEEGAYIFAGEVSGPAVTGTDPAHGAIDCETSAENRKDAP